MQNLSLERIIISSCRARGLRCISRAQRATSVDVTTTMPLTPIVWQYDDDGLLTQAGALELTHDATNGLLTANSVANLDSTFAYSPRGELASQAVTAGTTALYAATHARDALGRIASTSETIAGTTTANEYTYDAVGQLVEVTTDGTSSASYSYDPDGNRLSTTTAATSANATYDAQERLRTFGDSTYAYTPRGTLESRTTAGATTQYTYDPLGNLSAVALPDARPVVGDVGG
jgi:YD repeat-containing protein